MYRDQDRIYFTRRYEEELRRASEVDDDRLRALHHHWAELYRRRLSWAGRWGP